MLRMPEKLSGFLKHTDDDADTDIDKYGDCDNGDGDGNDYDDSKSRITCRRNTQEGCQVQTRRKAQESAENHISIFCHSYILPFLCLAILIFCHSFVLLF